MIKKFTFQIGLMLAVYAGVISTNEGLNNIGLTLLWFVAIMLLIILFKEETPNGKIDKVITKYDFWIILFMYLLSTFTIIYNGEILLGAIIFVSVVTQYAELHSKKEKGNKNV